MHVQRRRNSFYRHVGIAVFRDEIDLARRLFRIHPVSTHPSVLEELVDGSHIRWGLRVLKAVVSACLLDGYSADRLGS
jgi:hypothetical protein